MKKSQLEMYKECQSDLLRKYNGKIIAVKDGECLGDFQTKIDALREMSKKYHQGEFLIIRCTPGEREYTGYFSPFISFGDPINV